MKWLIKFLIIFVALAAVVVAWANFSMRHYMQTPMSNSESLRLTVNNGETLNDVCRVLKQSGASRDTHWLKLQARLDNNAAGIKAGQYTVLPGTTPSDLMSMLLAGAVDLESVALIEGWTAARAVATLLEHPAIVNDLEISVAQRADGEPWLDDEAQAKLVRLLDLPHVSIEGMLAPDTYRFAAGTLASVLLKNSHALMQQRVNAHWSPSLAERGIDNPYALVTLASIVEKETALASERAEIAGVFYRRLAKGMRLQTDPTVIYGIGQAYDGDIRRKDLSAKTPFNTYVIDGLPPTPISLVSEASLEASAAPAEGKALYFVASGDGDGSHRFSETLQEHEKAVAEYLRKLRGSRNR